MKIHFCLCSLWIIMVLTPSSWAGGYLGIKGGLDLGVATSNSTTYIMGSEIAYSAGLYGGVMFGEKIGLDLGVLYDIRGFSQTISGTAGTLTTTLPYVLVPISLTYSLVKEVNILFGPYFGINAGNVGGSSTISGLSPPSGAFSSNNLNSIDYGLQAAVRGVCPFSERWSAMLEVRYFLGLSNITSSGASVSLGDFQASLGLQLSL